MELKKLLEDFRGEGIEIKGKKFQANEWINERKKAHEKYKLKFLNIGELTKDEVMGFLSFDNNKSWTGLERRGVEALKDFDKFKKTLKFLLDESVDIKDRIQRIVSSSKGDFHIKGMGRNFTTAILHVCYPEKYGVFNNVVEEALEKIGRSPEYEWGWGWGSWYVETNKKLKEIAKELGTNLTEVDCLMYYISSIGERPPEGEGIEAKVPSEDEVLRPLVVENLDKLFPSFELFEDEDGNKGVDYSIPGAGRADIICIDKDSGDLVIIELKKGRSGEVAVGQLLKYIGGSMESLCEKDQRARGIIIVKEVDEKLRLAVLPIKNLISLKIYDIGVKLQDF